MTDNAQQDRSTFRLLDGGTMFSGRFFWLDDNNVTQCAAGVWAMQDVNSVTTFPATVLPEMPGPRCCLLIHGGHLYLQAEFAEVQLAWRRFRNRHTAEVQGVRFTPFSAS